MGRKRKKIIGLNEDTDTYVEVCWKHHEKSCVACGECLIVAAHHYNGHHWDNRPENLVPLCPTHHAYWHSRHRHLIEERVNEYVQRFIDDNSKLDDPTLDE